MLPRFGLHSPTNQLPRLVNLRWLEIASQLLVLQLATNGLGIALPLPAMLTITGALAAINLFTLLRLGQPWPVTDGEIFVQISVDVLALSGLLYFSGGSANPFVSLLIVPITIAATTLSPRLAWAMAILTLCLYTLLMFHGQPLPDPQQESPLVQRLVTGEAAVLPPDACHTGPTPGEGEPSGSATSFALHVLGMWLNFLVSGVVVAFFLTRMAGALRERERELAAVRESALRHEQILALGTLAAGAAHQLGTPLATLAVLLREMELEHGEHDPALGEDLALARQQVARCKDILSHILADAGRERSEGGAAIPLDQFLSNMLEDWQLLRPDVRLNVVLEGPQPAPVLLKDRTLEHALLNLLDNAADASPKGLELSARWNEDAWTLEILDRGPGLDQAVAAQAGRPFFSTKTEKGGLGIGLFLSNATIERFGGKVELFNRDTGGACTRVTLPLKRT